MTFDMNPRDDERDEEEMFVLAIAEMVQACEVSKAKLHTRAYVDHVRPQAEADAMVAEALMRAAEDGSSAAEGFIENLDTGQELDTDKLADAVNEAVSRHITDAGRLALEDVKRTARREAVDCLRDLFGFIESGFLVRDISRDGELGWAMNQITFVACLVKVRNLIGASPSAPGD